MRTQGAHIYFFSHWSATIVWICSGETDTLQSTFADKEEVLLFNLLGFGGRQPADGAGTWPVAGRDKGDSEHNTAGAPLMYQPGLSYITLIWSVSSLLLFKVTVHCCRCWYIGLEQQYLSQEEKHASQHDRMHSNGLHYDSIASTWNFQTHLLLSWLCFFYYRDCYS